MWCTIKNIICYKPYCDSNCSGYGYPSSQAPQKYGYKCTCGGEFMNPTSTQGTSAYNYKCPFCGRIMEGMK